MKSGKTKRVQLAALIADKETLLEKLGSLSYLTLEAAEPIPGSDMLFTQEGNCLTPQEAELIGVLGELPCAYSISDAPDAGGLFGKRKGQAPTTETPPVQGLDKVTARMLEETERQIKEIQAEADKQTAEIGARYEEEAQAVYWKRVTTGKEAVDQRSRGLSDIAAIEVKKQVLAFKQELVEQAFTLARGRLQDLSEERYVKFFATLCANVAQSGQERLIFSPRDRGHYGKRITMAANDLLQETGREGMLTMSEETREILGGVILTDGQIDVNCSIEALVEAQRRDLLIPVSEMLFDRGADV